MKKNEKLTMFGILVLVLPPVGIWFTIKDKQFDKIQKTIICSVGVVYTIAIVLYFVFRYGV